ncbi:MAG TPA: ABC transporter permease [Vicinamibacterales bacterium]
MSLLSRVVALWTRIAHRGRSERDLDDEIRATFDLLVAEKIQAGLTPEAARRAATIELGGVEQVKEQVREAQTGAFLDSVFQDLRHAARSLRRNPGFAGVAIFTLALGIGATTIVFSVVDALLLNPVPFRNPDRLVEIWSWSDRGGGPFQPSAMLGRWREQTQIFEQVEGHWETSFTVTGDQEPSTLWGSQVTVGLFSLLGVSPQLGRQFAPQEANARIVVISHGLWLRRFGADASIIGETLRLNDDVYTIVGVMPAAFRFPVARIELWVPFDPLRLNPLSPRGAVTPIARLRAGLLLDIADEQVSRLAPQLDDSLATRPRPGTTARLQTLNRYSTSSLIGQTSSLANTRLALWLIFGAAGLVLLLSCANSANLFLSRAVSGRRDMAVRAAVGAGRWRLMRYMLTEAVLVAAVAGSAGIVIAGWTLRGLAAVIPIDVADASLNPLDLDARAAAWSLLASLLAGLLAAVIPSAHAAGGDVVEPLRGCAEGTRGGRMGIRGILISVETALALLLLIGAGLTTRSLWTLLNADTGWSGDGVIVAQPDFRGNRYAGPEGRSDFFNRLVVSLMDTPGVEAVAVSEGLPLEPTAFWVGSLESNANTIPDAEVTNIRVSQDFFTTMGIRLQSGRPFTTADMDGRDVAIVSHGIAQQLWPGEPAIGKLFRFESSPQPLTVVGVAGDVRMQPFNDRRDAQEIYRPLNSPVGSGSMANQVRYLVIKTDSRGGLIAAVKHQASNVDPALAVRVESMRDIFRGTLAEPEFHARLLTGFGLIALLLAGAGVYAVVAYETNRRTQELGIRIALGATRGDVMRHVMGRATLFAALGIGAGMATALALSRLMTSMLYGLSPTDAGTFAGAAMFPLLVALAAACVPAWRATRVNPMQALRTE